MGATSCPASAPRPRPKRPPGPLVHLRRAQRLVALVAHALQAAEVQLGLERQRNKAARAVQGASGSSSASSSSSTTSSSSSSDKSASASMANGRSRIFKYSSTQYIHMHVYYLYIYRNSYKYTVSSHDSFWRISRCDPTLSAPKGSSNTPTLGGVVRLSFLGLVLQIKHMLVVKRSYS